FQSQRIPYTNALNTMIEQKSKITKDTDKQSLIVIVKPLSNSNYGQLVGVMNDLKIAKITRYAIEAYFTTTDQEYIAAANVVY
ncbi:MAG: hypothetical protein MUE30_18365, partial [Spirosomaceae bacterium]|nr:hypothetical protein [Spirosomataceae bacterium]